MGKVTRLDGRKAIKWTGREEQEAMLHLLEQSGTLSGVTLDMWEIRLHILKVYAGTEVDRRVVGYEWSSEGRAEDAGRGRPWWWEIDDDVRCRGVMPTAVAALDDYEAAVEAALARFGVDLGGE